MLRSILSCSVAVLAITAAQAADPTQPYAPGFDWNGFYAGINGGYGGGEFSHPYELVAPGPVVIINGTADVTAGGFIGGVQAGYNWQMDQFFLGLEGDLQASNITGQAALAIVDVQGIIGNPGDTLNLAAGTRLDWLATLRPRLGYVHDEFVVYVTGGLAYGRTDSFITVDVNGGPPLFGGNSLRDRWGYTLGTGLEVALTDNITMKTEYLYTNLGSVNVVALGFGGGAFNMNSDVAFHAVRAGLNVQLD